MAARKYFNTAFFGALTLAVILMIIFYVFSYQILSVFGAQDSDELKIASMQYLPGLILSFAPTILNPIIVPILQATGKKNYVTISIAAGTILSIGLDCIVALLNLGVQGISFVIFISSTVNIVILLIPFFNEKILTIKIYDFNFIRFLYILKIGTPVISKRLSHLINRLTINNLVMYFGGSLALSAVFIREYISNLFLIFAIALSSAMMLLIILYYGENNKYSFFNLIKKTLKCAATMAIVMLVIVFIFADKLAQIYTSKNPEVLKLTIDAIRFLSIDLVFKLCVEILTYYWQGIKKIKEVNIIVFLHGAIYPILSILVLWPAFGLTGIWMAFPTSTLLTLITYGIAGAIKLKKYGCNIFGIFPVPQELIYKDKYAIEFFISKNKITNNTLNTILKNIEGFCLANKIEQNRIKPLQIVFTQAFKNIIAHGFYKKNKNYYIDIFLIISNKNITLRLRDNCDKFDVVKKYKTIYRNEEPQRHFGIKKLMELSLNVKYVYTFNNNNLIIEI